MSYFAPYIDASGIHMPTYEDRLQDLLSAYRTIFGQEAELSPAVPDYQLLSVFAKALDDTSALVLQAYNSRNPGESDASARARMRLASAARGAFSMEAMEAALRQISGVTHVRIRVNDEDTAADGIPGHTVAAMVSGGNAGLIAEAIWRKKPPGIATAGTTSRTVTDAAGNSHTVRFSRPGLLAVSFRIELRSYEGFEETEVVPAMKEALMTYVNETLDIGEAINVPQLYGMLYRAAGNAGSSFSITDMTCSGNHGVSRERITPEWNQKFTLMSASEVSATANHGYKKG